MWDIEKTIEEMEANRNDFVMYPCGRNGENTCIASGNGAFVGKYGDIKLAQLAIKERIRTQKEHPNVWYKGLDGKVKILSVDGL